MRWLHILLLTILATILIFEGSQLSMNIGAVILVAACIAAIFRIDSMLIKVDNGVNVIEVVGLCEECSKGVMCAIRSQFIKKCSSCGHEEKWELKPGQRPLIENNRRAKKG